MLYILLPVHNRIDTTREFIHCLQKQNYTDYRLIVIDDGSTDGTCQMIKDNIPGSVILRGTGNLWWAGCLQRARDFLCGIPVNQDDIVLIINDDVTFLSDFLLKGQEFLRNNTDSLLLAREYTESGEVKETGVSANLSQMRFPVATSNKEINCLSTRGLFLTWKTMCQVGDFRPRMLPHYWSDYEYTIRAYKKGFELVTDPSVYLQIQHDNTGLRSTDSLSFYAMAKALFSKKSTFNPIYRSFFIFLVCPKSRIMINILLTWYMAGRELIKKLI